MLSEKQNEFLIYWEKERENESTVSRKLIGGLPMAVMFFLPIVLFIVIVYLFLPDWYMKVSSTTQGTFITILVAILIAVIFFAYTRMHFKWEMNEQLYLELKQQKASEENSRVVG